MIPDYLDLRHCDNMELMAQFPDKHFDVAIVDPPYGIGINVSMGRRKGDKKSDYHKFHGGDKMIPTAAYFQEVRRISANQIVWGGNYMTNHLPPSPCWIMWDKGFSEDLTFAQFEMAWTSFASSAKKFDQHPSQQHRIHPTQKPVQLYKWLLKNYAKEGDKILDTHLGSASIAIAVHEMNKQGMNLTLTGCELDEDYYNQAMKRVENACLQQTLFP